MICVTSREGSAYRNASGKQCGPLLSDATDRTRGGLVILARQIFECVLTISATAMVFVIPKRRWKRRADSGRRSNSTATDNAPEQKDDHRNGRHHSEMMRAVNQPFSQSGCGCSNGNAQNNPIVQTAEHSSTVTVSPFRKASCGGKNFKKRHLGLFGFARCAYSA